MRDNDRKCDENGEHVAEEFAVALISGKVCKTCKESDVELGG